MGNFGGLAHLMVGWYSDLSDGAISPVDGIRKQTVAKLIDVGSVGAFSRRWPTRDTTAIASTS